MAERFHYTFASDLGELEGTNATNGTFAQSAGAGLNGTSGGITATRTANSPNLYGFEIETFATASVIRTAWYTDLSSLTIGTDNDNTGLMRIYVASDQILGLTAVIRLSGVLNFRLYGYDDTAVATVASTPLAYPDWMEMRLERATTNVSADGNAQLYAGGGDYAATGELVTEVTGVDNYDKFIQINRVLFGMHNVFSRSTSVGGSLKFDEWIVRDDNTPILFGVSQSTISRGMKYVLNRRRRKQQCW